VEVDEEAEVNEGVGLPPMSSEHVTLLASFETVHWEAARAAGLEETNEPLVECVKEIFREATCRGRRDVVSWQRSGLW
jgi:hypothetical protein